MKKLGTASGALALGLGLVWAAPGALAQTAPDTALEKIEVTGSSIRRTDTETASPVQVITHDDLVRSGYTDTSDVLRNVAANGQGTLSQSFGQAFAGGASGIALRGLNLGATLVLIDGHRMAPYPLSDDGQRSFVDISSIPFDAIDDIEILKDGASAIYGSDAVAGVVNIRLKKTYTGFRMSAEQGLSGHGDGATTHIAAMGGFGDLAADGYNGYLSLEYRHQANILTSARSGDWTRTDFSGFPNGLNNTPGTPSPFLAYPSTTTGIIFNPNGSGAYTFLPGCSAGAYASNQCAFNWQGLELQPDTKNINLLARFTKALAGGWKDSFELSQFTNRAEQVGPTYPGASAFGSSLSNGTISLVNFNPNHLTPTLVNYGPITVPANYPGNIYGVPTSINQVITSLGLTVTTYDTKTIRAVNQLSGSIAGFDVNLDAGYTKATTHEVFTGLLQPALLQNALNNGYVLNSPGGRALIAPDQTAAPSDELDFISANVSKDLLMLPGGALAGALGAEYDHRNLDAQAPLAIATGQSLGNDAFAVGQQNVAGLYVEFDAPVIKQLELSLKGRYDHYDTGASATSPQAGITYQPVEALKLRGTWGKGFRAPNPAEAGLAGQQYAAAGGTDPVLCPHPTAPNGLAAGNFPSQCSFLPTGLNTSAQNLQPEKSTNETLGFVFEPTKSINLSVDWFDIKLNNQIDSPGFLGSIPAAGINLPTTTVRGPSLPLPYCPSNPCTAANEVTVQTASIYPQVSGPIAFLKAPYINATLTETNGVDVDLRYAYDLHEAGKLHADLNVTHMINYNISVAGKTFHEAGTHGPSFFSGDTGNPRNRAVLVLAWDKKPYEVAATINYVSSISITDPAFNGQDQCSGASQSAATSEWGFHFLGGPAPSNFCKVASFTDVDVSGRYDFDKHWTVRGSILNLFDRAPPVDIVTYGGGGSLPYNAALHQAGAVGRYFTVGAAYSF